MTVDTDTDLRALMRIGRIVGSTLRDLARLIEPGMTTLELDREGARMLESHGARSAPPMVYGFPGNFCISINHEAAHGIPSTRVLKSDDFVKIDLTAELNGYMADAAVTVIVPPSSVERRDLAAAAKEALRDAVRAARAGRQINTIGRAAESVTHRHGYSVVRELCGHGVGRTIHEEPRFVPNYDDPRALGRLRKGMVIAIEPHITTGTGAVETLDDGWTIATVDRSPVANFEHTVVVTDGRPIILTAA
jgi:methionyl aminopeptidase